MPDNTRKSCYLLHLCDFCFVGWSAGWFTDLQPRGIESQGARIVVLKQVSLAVCLKLSAPVTRRWDGKVFL